MIQIYHNNRCSKSRFGLKILEKSGKDFEVVNYLETIPSIKKLNYIVNLLGISPIELVRKNETFWKQNYKNKELSDDDIIKIMVNNPKLIDRPIVINNNKAVIGRPPEKIFDIL